MMKKACAVVLIFSFVLALSAPAYCDDAVKKLGRGICNVITSPFEINEQTKRVNETDGPMAALTYGMLKGAVKTVIRAAVGIYEIMTFPAPVPKDYQPILKDPEFFFEEELG